MGGGGGGGFISNQLQKIRSFMENKILIFAIGVKGKASYHDWKLF